MKAGSIFGKLPIPINEIEDPSVPRQLTNQSCGVACGQMLLESIGVISTHSKIVAAAGDDFLTIDELAAALKKLSLRNWTSQVLFPDTEGLDNLTGSKPAAIQFEQGFLSHWVIFDGYDPIGNIQIRDPWGKIYGTRYKTRPIDFVKFWNGTVVRLIHE